MIAAAVATLRPGELLEWPFPGRARGTDSIVDVAYGAGRLAVVARARPEAAAESNRRVRRRPLPLVDSHPLARSQRTECLTKAGYEGPKVLDPIASRSKRNDSDRQGAEVLLMLDPCVHCHERVVLACRY
jgi:hypothetical protein